MVEPGGRRGLEGLVAGSIVITLFPFTDGSDAKRRPAFVLKVLRHDAILLQVTSQYLKDGLEIPLGPDDFARGGLSRFSVVRPEMIATMDLDLIAYEVGQVTDEKKQEIIDTVCALIKE